MAICLAVTKGLVLLFEDKSIGYVLSQYVGTVLLLVVAFIFIEGVLRIRRERKDQQGGLN